MAPIPQREPSRAKRASAGDAREKRGFIYLLSGVAALAGLLFGYDTGVISGALLFLRTEFRLDAAMQGAVTSVVLVGAVVGALTSGPFNDRFGRRAMLVGAAVIFAGGAVLSALATGIPGLLVGRLIVGVGIGVSSYTGPLYISECAPADARGALVSLSQLAVTAGIVVAYVVDLAFAYPGGWRWMFGVALAPALLLGAGMLALPDSPRSLMNRGFAEEARGVLLRMHGEATARAALDEMEGARAKERSAGLEAPGWKELFQPSLRRPLAVGVGLAVFQQFIGINTVIYYAPVIFKDAGFATDAAAILATVGVGLVNVGMTVAAMALLDRAGRRPLLLVGIAGMVLALAAMGAAFQLPEARRGIAAVASLMVFVACFAFSLGPIFWLMIAEIYPLRVRGRAISTATFANWGANLLVTFTFPLLLAAAGASATFWLYAFLGMAAFLFSWRLVPETKGRSLEEIEARWIK